VDSSFFFLLSSFVVVSIDARTHTHHHLWSRHRVINMPACGGHSPVFEIVIIPVTSSKQYFNAADVVL
jgi:hypothetical protein